jgi:hypothetical protein
MGYGGKSNEIKEISYMSHGVHENVYIKEIKAHVEKSKDGSAEYDVIDIIFAGATGDFKLRVFNPDNSKPEDLDKNQKYASDVLLYIASKLSNSDKEITGVTNWASLKSWFKANLPQAYSSVKLALKLTGNVYNGKANIQVTRYFGWLDRMDSPKRPIMSASEIKGNLEYDAFQAKKAGAGIKANDTKDAASSEEMVF